MMVGWTFCVKSERAVTIASIAPDAPKACPSILLVELTHVL